MNLPKTLVELHHAYVASCDTDTLIGELEKRGVPRAGCPDVFVHTCQQFSINDARELRSRAIMNPLVLSRRVFIFQCASIATEAQNALLKTLEEPRGNAIFFFLLSSPERLLSTFRSRTQEIAHKNTRLRKSCIDVGDFLQAKPAQRITMLEVFTKKKDSDLSAQAGERDMRGIMLFLDELEQALSTRHKSLPAVYRAKRYISDRGALVKPLLEQIALLV